MPDGPLPSLGQTGGIITPRTRRGSIASTAIAAVNPESTPPDRYQSAYPAQVPHAASHKICS